MGLDCTKTFRLKLCLNLLAHLQFLNTLKLMENNMRPSMRILITAFSMIFLANSSLAGEQEDVSKCISAAKRYADVSLGRSNYKYDGGWFNSDVSWHGNTPAFCEVGSKVNKLVISGITYVVDGFAGAQARVVYVLCVLDCCSCGRGALVAL